MIKPILVGALLMLPLLAQAQAKTYSLQMPQFSLSQTEREQQNQWQPIGKAYLASGVAVPAYAVRVNNPVEDGFIEDTTPCTRKSCDLPRFNIPAQYQKQVMALRISGIGWVVVPHTWRQLEATVGVNGSQSLLIKSVDGKEWLTHEHTGACVGCAYSSAAPFFPAAQKLARENEFFYQLPNPQIHIVRVSAHKVLFSYRLPNSYETHGVARFNPQDDEAYQNLRVTLKPENKSLAGAILNAGVGE